MQPKGATLLTVAFLQMCIHARVSLTGHLTAMHVGLPIEKKEQVYGAKELSSTPLQMKPRRRSCMLPRFQV